MHNLDLDEYTTIVDAIFGVGLSRPVEGKYAELISTMNRASAYKVAVDIPSGLTQIPDLRRGLHSGQILRLPCFLQKRAVFLSRTHVWR